MHRFIMRTSEVATWALAVMPIIALAGAAHAAEVRIPVGDLSQPAAAAAFAHRLDSAANSLCASYARPIDGAGRLNACKQAVRDEAMAKLGPAQRMQVSQAAGGSSASAAS